MVSSLARVRGPHWRGGGAGGWGGSHQLLPLGAVLSPARPPALHPPGCRERPGGGKHAPKGCRTLAFGVHSNLPASDPLELTLTWEGAAREGTDSGNSGVSPESGDTKTMLSPITDSRQRAFCAAGEPLCTTEEGPQKGSPPAHGVCRPVQTQPND